MATSSGLLLDACCLLNICASGCFDAIAEALDSSIMIAEAVSKEALYVRGTGSAQNALAREAIDLSVMLSKGILAIVALDEAELVTLFVFCEPSG